MREKIDAIIHQWLVEHIYNSPISRDTQGYNHLAEKLPILKEAIAKLWKPETKATKQDSDIF